MAVPDMYRDAPTKVKVGRVLVIIGSLLFFLGAFLFLLEFILYFVPGEEPVDWTDPTAVFSVVKCPFLIVFYILAGIGGLCYAFDKHRMKTFASLAGVIMLVVVVIGTVLMFHDLIKSSLAPNANLGQAFLEFFTDFLAIQIVGGVYFIGWFLVKDYTGD